MSETLRSEARLKWSAAVCVSIASILWLGPWLLRVDLYSQDAMQHIFWLYRFSDPALFPLDLSVEYFSAPSSAPIGYRALYAWIGPRLDVLVAAEWGAVLLLVYSAYMAWRIGNEIGKATEPKLLGLLTVVALLVLLPFVDVLPPIAFQRSFALPFVLLCTWALLARRYGWVGVSWVLAACFYPIVVPVLGLTAGVVFLADLLRSRRLPAKWLWNGVLGAGALALVLMHGGDSSGLGPSVTLEQAMSMPEFGPGGRQALFGIGASDYWLRHHRTGLGLSPWLIVMITGSLGVILWRGHVRMVPLPVWAVAIVGTGLWLVARLVLFDLYLPNRHSRWALAVFAVVVLAVATLTILRSISDLAEGDRYAVSRASFNWVALAAPLVVTAALFPSASAAWRLPVDSDLESVYAFVSRMPKETLIAAHPNVADAVPLRTHRSVLASSESSLAFMMGYYQRIKPRVEASLRAAYASSWGDLDQALQPYGVDVVLTGPPVWTADDYYRPFDTLVRGLRTNGQARGFVLQAPPPERVLFQSGDWYVVRVTPKDPAGG